MSIFDSMSLIPKDYRQAFDSSTQSWECIYISLLQHLFQVAQKSHNVLFVYMFFTEGVSSGPYMTDCLAIVEIYIYKKCERLHKARSGLIFQLQTALKASRPPGTEALFFSSEIQKADPILPSHQRSHTPDICMINVVQCGKTRPGQPCYF